MQKGLQTEGNGMNQMEGNEIVTEYRVLIGSIFFGKLLHDLIWDLF
jgi:hypothetical protein